MVTREEFRSAMSQFATGVTVITTIDDHGRPHAMTANAFTSVCLEPPTVLICVAHGTHTYGYLEKNGHFGVNILARDQQELGAYFARRPEDRKDDVSFSYTRAEKGGLSILEDSLVYLGCEVIGAHIYGDHTIYLGEVKEIRRNHSSAPPLMFFQSRWYNPLSAE